METASPAGGILPFLAVSGLVILGAAGCSSLDPTPKELDFGKVYVGASSELGSARWTNTDASRSSDILGALSQPPYHIENQGAFVGSRVSAGGSTPDLQLKFSPTDTGNAPGRVEVASQPVTATPLKVKGAGVWQKSEGDFVLENLPPPGVAMMGSTPIVPNAPIDFGTRVLGGSATSVAVQIRSGRAVAGTAAAKMLNGRRHFEITFPQNHDAFNIGDIGPPPGGGGAREIRVRFTPSEIGEWSDVLEVTDSRNPQNRAGIVLKAKVVKGE